MIVEAKVEIPVEKDSQLLIEMKWNNETYFFVTDSHKHKTSVTKTEYTLRAMMLHSDCVPQLFLRTVGLSVFVWKHI